MTMRAVIETRITELESELSILKSHLTAGYSWLDAEVDDFESWAKALISKVRGIPPTPPAAP